MKQLIEFKKQRELGDILSDTFKFIREEFKPFLKTILQISGPYLVLFLIAMAFYLYTAGNISSLDFTQNFNINLPLMLGSMFLFFVTGVLAYVFANSAVIHYIKSYIENEGNVNIDAVKQNVKDSFWGFLGLGILKWITLAVAMLFCVFPVLYFMVPMYIVFCIYIFEKKEATEAYSYSYTLIKNEFWISLATIFVIGIIVLVASYAFSLPAGIYSIVKTGILSGEIDPANMTSLFDPVYIILNIISYLFQFLLNLILTVSSVFLYFNLNEKLNFTGTFERIESLGKTND